MKWMLLAALAIAGCSSKDSGGGSGGTSPSGGGGSAGSGGVSSGGAPSDAGCVIASACSDCLGAECAAELAACDGFPSCAQARTDQSACFEQCIVATTCWSNFVVSGGSKAGAVQSCAQAHCALCQP